MDDLAERLTKLAARNLSALALGLGVGITPPPTIEAKTRMEKKLSESRR